MTMFGFDRDKLLFVALCFVALALFPLVPILYIPTNRLDPRYFKG